MIDGCRGVVYAFKRLISCLGGTPNIREYRKERAVFVSHIESSLLDAVIRLARLLDNPQDIAVLVSLYTEEILYRVLQGQKCFFEHTSIIKNGHRIYLIVK